MLLDPYRFGGVFTGLRRDLISYWKLDETAGSALDVHGVKPLADALATYVPGRVGSAKDFEKDAVEYFNLPSNASLTTGDIDFTFSVWVNAETLSGDCHIFSKLNTGAGDGEFRLYFNSAVSRYEWAVLNSGGSFGVVRANTFGAPPLGVWTHIVCWHDSVNNQIGISVNNGTADVLAWTSGVRASASYGFRIGAQSHGSLPQSWDGGIDELGYWKRMLTPVERTALYDGLAYSTFDASYKTSLISYWAMDGSVADSHGTNHFTDAKATVSAAGKINTARSFPSGSYFSSLSGAELSTGDIDFTIAVWVYRIGGGTRGICGKFATAQNEFSLITDGSNNIRWSVVGPGGTTTITGPFLNTSVWYHVIAWHDSVNNRIGLTVNGAGAVSTHNVGAFSLPANPFMVGGPVESGMPFWQGALDEIGFWKRVLGSVDRYLLYNSGNGLAYPLAASATLLTGLVSYWRLDEASGNAADSHGTNHLPDINTVTSAPGKIGTARDFERTNSERFLLANNASLQTGDIDFTVSAWFKIESFAAKAGIVARDHNSPSWNEYMIFHNGTTNRVCVQVWNGAYVTLVADSFGALSLDTWYFVMFWHDPVLNRIYLQINNGTVDEMAFAGPMPLSSADFCIGADSNSVASFPFDGLIDEVAFWKRQLEPDERAALYNSGNGLTYPFDGSIPAPVTWLTNLVSYWKMDEASGDAIDIHGANHLTDTNTVGTAVGKVGTARDFVRVNGEYFTRTSGASLTTGDIDFTISCWVFLTDRAAERAIVSKWKNSTSEFEFYLSFNYSSDRFQWIVRNTGNGSSSSIIATGGAIVAGSTWYHIVCWHDSVNNQIGITVNDGVSSGVFATTVGVAPFPALEFMIGSKDIGAISTNFGGLIDEVGFWKRMLTPAERTQLYAFGDGVTYPTFLPPPPNLLLGLVSYWKLDEASGNATDSHGANHLTDTNTVGSGTGKIGNARDFDKPASEHFTRTSGADLTTGDIDFTFSAWVKIETATSHTVLSKWASQTEFFISIDSSRQVFFRVNTPGGNVAVSSLTFAVVVGTWSHIVVWHDSVSDQIGISVDNATPRLSVCSGGLTAFPAIAFKIGLTESGFNEPFNGMIDEVGFWKRMLTNTERAALYNGSNGKTYPFT